MGPAIASLLAQVYLSLPSYTGEPPKRLVGWERVTLAPGRSKTVAVEIERQLRLGGEVGRPAGQISASRSALVVHSPT